MSVAPAAAAAGNILTESHEPETAERLVSQSTVDELRNHTPCISASLRPLHGLHYPAPTRGSNKSQHELLQGEPASSCDEGRRPLLAERQRKRQRASFANRGLDSRNMALWCNANPAGVKTTVAAVQLCVVFHCEVAIAGTGSISGAWHVRFPRRP